MYTFGPNIIYVSSTFWWEVFKLREKALIKQKLCEHRAAHYEDSLVQRT
jgi:hypothetical protein